MSDDALHPDHELASAYLDGELEQDERALVEGSPTTLAVVEVFAVVHDRLVDVQPAPAAARDAAVAAALSEFDSLHSPMVAAAFAAPPPPAIPLFRRTGVRILSAAAALLLVGIVGVAALTGGGDNDSDSNADSPDADRQVEVASEESDGASDDESGGGAPADVLASTTIGAITGPATAPPQVMSESDLLALAEQLTITLDAGGEAAQDTTAPYATAFTGDAETPVSTAPVAAACPLTDSQVYLMDIIWIDTSASLVIDTASGEALAIGADCTVLARATP